MKAHDKEDFKKAMHKEVNDLMNENVFDIIPLNQKPTNRKLIRFIWSFKCKRSSIGVLLKHKA